jgi:cytochrome oxidase Cu insertion factor (SCO1/SenC/PrrC family)
MTRWNTRYAGLALAVAGLTWLLGGAAPAATDDLPEAPDFTLTLLDGKTLALRELRGKPVLLNFWWSQ